MQEPQPFRVSLGLQIVMMHMIFITIVMVVMVTTEPTVLLAM